MMRNVASISDLRRQIFKALRGLLLPEMRITFDQVPLRFHNVPLKKRLNWILVEASTILRPERPWGMPHQLMIEPTTYCNLRCALCPVTSGMDRATGNMEFTLFKKVIDEIGDYLLFLMLWNWGEPFLNPSIYEMISYAKERKIKIISSTNGHAFMNEPLADRLVRSGIDGLIVSLDGLTQKTYQQYRRGGTLDTVIGGIKNIAAAKAKLNSRTPYVDLRFIVMKHNEHEIPELARFAQSYPVDGLTLKTLNPYDPSFTKEDGSAFLPRDPRYRRFNHDSATDVPLPRNQSRCKNLWNSTVVNWGPGWARLPPSSWPRSARSSAGGTWR